MARPSSRALARAFTEDRRAKVVDWLRIGNFRESAAARVGIHPQTLSSWVCRGQQEIAARDDAIDRVEAGEDVRVPELSERGQFALLVLEAESEAENQMVGQVLAGKVEDIRWFLERRWPQRYGRGVARVELSGPEGKPVEVRDARQTLLRRILAVAPEGEGEADSAEPAAG